MVTALLTGDFAGAWTAVKGIWGAGMDALIAIVGGLWGVFKSIGGAAIDGLIAGLRAGWSAIKATVSELANFLPEWTRKLLGIHSPSRVFAEIGGHIMGGLDQGLADNAGAPLRQMAKVADSMSGAMAGATIAPPVLPKLSPPRRDAIEPPSRSDLPGSIAAPIINPPEIPAIDDIQLQVPDIPPVEILVSAPPQPIEWPVVASPIEAIAPITNPSIVDHERSSQPTPLAPLDAPRLAQPEPIEWPIVRPAFDGMASAASPVLQPDHSDVLSIIPRIMESAAAIGRALKAGAAGAAVVAAPVAATAADSRDGACAGAAPNYNYSIIIHAGGGADAQDIAAKVREELEKIEREKRGRGFHDED